MTTTTKPHLDKMFTTRMNEKEMENFDKLARELKTNRSGLLRDIAGLDNALALKLFLQQQRGKKSSVA